MRNLTESAHTIWFVVFNLEGIVIIFCNIISLILFSRKARHSKPFVLLINQSLVDLLVGLEAICYSLQFLSLDVTYLGPPNPQKDECFSATYIFMMATINFVVDLSLASLALVALDRTFALFKPFQHRVLKSKHYYYGILVVWILCLVPSTCITMLRCEISNTLTKVAFGLSMFTSLVTLLVLVAAYTSIYIKVKFFPVFQNATNTQTSSQIKLSLTLFYASVASMTTIIPSTLIMIYLFVRPIKNPTNGPDFLGEFAVFMVFANSFINFFIYAWRFSKFVKDMKRLLCCTKCVVNEVLSIEMAATK